MAKKVLLFLAQGFEAYEPSVFTDVFGWNRDAGLEAVDLITGFYEDANDERFLNLIREFNRRDKLIATICVAALPIAKSGVLNQRNATTWDLN